MIIVFWFQINIEPDRNVSILQKAGIKFDLHLTMKWTLLKSHQNYYTSKDANI